MQSRIIAALCASLTVLSISLIAGASNVPSENADNGAENAVITGTAQNEDLNAAGDNIIGNYYVDHRGEISKVKVYKASDGTYSAQVFWVKNRLEKDGSVRKDTKNPDKSLRNIDCDKIMIFKGLKYDSSSKTWGGTSIYDPVRGINASLSVWFKDSKTLALRGSKMGISGVTHWVRL